jgi:transcriptional regulator with XRE-family HTH domain
VEDDADQVIRNVGLRVAELRQRLGMSQRAFAAKVGLTSGNYSQIESGKQNLTLRMMVRIAKGLGVTLADLCQPPETP